MSTNTSSEQNNQLNAKAAHFTQVSGVLTIIIIAVQMITSAMDIGNLETAEFATAIGATSVSTLGFWGLNSYRLSGAKRD